MLLKNKVAIVTGARQGIGKGIALALASEGCNVVVSDIDHKDCEKVVGEVQELGVKGLAVECDVTDKGQVDTLVAETVKTFGQLDILVNNAGIYPFKPFMEMTEVDWDRVMDVNLKGTFLCTQAAVREMGEGSKIVDISSIASVVGFDGLTHYCTTKGGVNAMIRALALELAPKKITVNAVAPGAIETPGASGGMDDKAREQIIAAIPLQRWGQPEDIAQAVVFLASDKSGYITGQVVIVDGGWTLR